jgi:hypothetical protein
MLSSELSYSTMERNRSLVTRRRRHRDSARQFNTRALRKIHRQHVEGLRPRWDHASRGESASSPSHGLRKSGEEFRRRLRSRGCRSATKTLLTVALRDITNVSALRRAAVLMEAGAVLAASLDYEQTWRTWLGSSFRIWPTGRP